MIAMNDSELRNIRQKKLRELQRRFTEKQEKTPKTDANNILDRVFKDRAWEVFNNANSQFPYIMNRVKDVLVKLVISGRLSEITGEQLYLFLRNLGLRVKLETKISIVEHGKTKSLADKIKEDLQKA